MRFEVYQDPSREWRWRLIAKNGKIVADSGESYSRRRKCLEAIERVRSIAWKARVETI